MTSAKSDKYFQNTNYYFISWTSLHYVVNSVQFGKTKSIPTPTWGPELKIKR